MVNHPFEGIKWIEYSIGAVFVLTSASQRFNTPPRIRSYTTVPRYVTAWLCYLALELTLYLGLVSLIVRVMQGSDATGLAAGPIALLVAVPLTLLLPHVPILPTVDAWVCKRLHKMAAIPFEARQLATRLRKSALSFSPGLQAEIKTRMAGQGFDSAEITFDEGPGLDQVWTEITGLMIHLEGWKENRKFEGFMTRYTLDFKDLKHRFGQLEPRIRLIHEIGLPEPAATGDRFAALVRTEAIEQGAELLNRIYEFISRGLLQACATYAARISELKRLGFDSRDVGPRERVSLDQLIALFLAINGAMLAGTMILTPLGGIDAQYWQSLSLGTMLSIMYTVAVLCAVYPKERWSFARRKGGSRPTASYGVAGVLAVAASLVIRLVFLLLTFHSWPEAWLRFCRFYPISLCAFVAAFMVAWMIDDETTSRLPRNRLRLLEGGLGSAAMLLGSSAALEWIESMTAALSLSSRMLMLGQSTVIGFAIAYLIPTWYRETAREVRHTAEPELPGGAAAQAA